jgi:hypothetical protein
MNPQLVVSKNSTIINQGFGPGEKASFNGVVYEVVDNTLLRERVRQQVNLSKLCTSLVTCRDYFLILKSPSPFTTGT